MVSLTRHVEILIGRGVIAIFLFFWSFHITFSENTSSIRTGRTETHLFIVVMVDEFIHVCKVHYLHRHVFIAFSPRTPQGKVF